MSLVTHIPFDELVQMPPELLATYYLVAHDQNTPEAERIDLDD